MPEGPEMRRAADELGRVLTGRVARQVWFKFAQLASSGRRLSGRRVRGVEARGKALILHFAGGSSVYTHNQLYGKWLVGPAGERPETARDLRLVIETREHAALLYSASEIAVLPLDASITGVPCSIQPLHSAYRNSERASRCFKLPVGCTDSSLKYSPMPPTPGRSTRIRWVSAER